MPNELIDLNQVGLWIKLTLVCYWHPSWVTRCLVVFLWGERIYFSLHFSVYLKKPKVGNWSKSHGEVLLTDLFPPDCSVFSYTTIQEDLLPKGCHHPQSAGPSLPHQCLIKKMLTQSCQQAHLIESFSQSRSPLLGYVWVCNKLIKAHQISCLHNSGSWFHMFEHLIYSWWCCLGRIWNQ